MATRGRARIAISGGGAPKPVFQALADPAQPWRARMPWDKLEIYWVDERCVPPTDPQQQLQHGSRSHAGPGALQPAQIHRMEGELEPEEGAARYESELRNGFRAGRRRDAAIRSSSSSAWAPTATPRRCFRAARRCTNLAGWRWPT